jgi:hypothetical protein
MCFDSVNLYKYQFQYFSADVNCVVLFTNKPVVISWFKPIFQECDALAFSEGRKFPIAAFYQY